MQIVKDLERLSDENYITQASYVELMRERLRIISLIDIMSNEKNRLFWLNKFNEACEKQNRSKIFKEIETSYEDKQHRIYKSKQNFMFKPIVSQDCRSTQHLKKCSKAFMPTGM